MPALTFFNSSIDAIHEPIQLFDTIGTGIFVLMLAIIGGILILIIYKILTGD